MFASVGADGSVRLFDLRHLEHSTIIYEDPQRRSLLRLAWCKTEPTYLVTIAQDTTEVGIMYINQSINQSIQGHNLGRPPTVHARLSSDQSQGEHQRGDVGATQRHSLVQRRRR